MLFPPLAFWDEGRAREKDNGPYVPGAWGGIVILPVPGVGKGRGGGPQPAGRGVGAGGAAPSLVGLAGAEPESDRGSGPRLSAAETPNL